MNDWDAYTSIMKKKVITPQMENGIPIFLPINTEFDLANLYARQNWIDKAMFAFVSWRWVNPLSELLKGKKVLEVMAGRGWLAHALRLKKIDIIATDNLSWFKRKNGKPAWDEPLTEIEKINAQSAIKKYGEKMDYVIMSWPYMDRTAARVLKLLHEVNPNAILIYIGESQGGCTASDEFFEYFEEINTPEFSTISSKFQSWDGIHDEIYFGKFYLNKLK